MTNDQIRPWLELCEKNQPEWWGQIKDLPTDEDKMDALVMLGVRMFEAQGGTPEYHLKN